jgi:predicted ArsR family transcriptional regulator
LIRKHLQQLTEHGCFIAIEQGETEMFRPTLRYQIQVRELAAAKFYDRLQKSVTGLAGDVGLPSDAGARHA